MEKRALSKLFFIILVVAAACGKRSSSELTSEEEQEAAVAVSLASAAANLGNTSSTIVRNGFDSAPRTSRTAQILRQLFSLPTAMATTTSCTQGAITDSCVSGNRSASYSSCPIGASGLTFSGSVNLAYSNASCVLPPGSTVTRTTNITRQALRGAQVKTSSDSYVDFKGRPIGGGIKYTAGSGALSVDILGMRKVRTDASGNQVMDISTYTSQAFVLDSVNSPATIQSGALVVSNNLKKSSATASVSNLVYDQASCCYPSSGKIAIAYTGSSEKSADVTFGPLCGEASISLNGVSQSLTLLGCE